MGPLLHQGRTYHGLGSQGSESPVLPLPLPQDGEASALLLGRAGAALGFVTCGPAPDQLGLRRALSPGVELGAGNWGDKQVPGLRMASAGLCSAPASRNKVTAEAGEKVTHRRHECQSQKQDEKPRGAHKGTY